MFSSIVGHCTECCSTLIPTEVTQVAPPHVVCFRVSHFSSGCSLFKLSSDDGQPSARSTLQSIYQIHFRLSGHQHHHNDDDDDDYPPNLFIRDILDCQVTSTIMMMTMLMMMMMMIILLMRQMFGHEDHHQRTTGINQPSLVSQQCAPVSQRCNVCGIL